MNRTTHFGSLRHYEKGGVEVINDDARNYVLFGDPAVQLRQKDMPALES